jgi:hypothetical protein
MNPQPQQASRTLTSPEQNRPLGVVRLTRFTIHSDRRADLLQAAQTTAGGCTGPPRRLLIELDNGDWLDINITDTATPPDDFPYLHLAHGIVGDEDGTIHAATTALNDRPEDAEP